MEQLVYFSIIFIVILCLWTIIAYPKNYLFKAIFIPLVLIVSISVGVTYKALLGYPTDSEAGGYQVFHHFIPDQQNKDCSFYDQLYLQPDSFCHNYQ